MTVFHFTNITDDEEWQNNDTDDQRQREIRYNVNTKEVHKKPITRHHDFNI